MITERSGKTSMFSRKGGALAILVSACLIAGMATATPATQTGSISGVVTVDGTPTAGVGVEAELIHEDPFIGFIETAGDGSYIIMDLPPGDYTVRFSLEEYLQEWYDNRYDLASADPVTVIDGQETTGIDADLTQGGAIAGRVGDSHAGLFGHTVEIHAVAGEQPVQQAGTDEDGNYVAGLLPPGEYKLYYVEGDVWYDGEDDFSSADVVVVEDRQTTSGVDFVVDTTGSISGTVFGEYFGPVPDVDVGLVDPDLQLLDVERTDAAGEFRFEGVPTGIYYLLAVDPLGDFAETWYPDSDRFDMAFGVPVAVQEQVTGRDIFMPAIAPGGFTDIEGSIFEADIVWLALNGITRGCNPPDNDLFCPGQSVTRGQMAAFIVRALGLTERLDDPFVDDDGSVFEADIERLAAAGITRGCNPPVNDRFCPQDPLTRAQMAAFLVRALGYTDDGGGNLFVDDDGSVFESDIDRLGTAGVTRGCNPPVNDRFCPGEQVTRAQMAAFLHRALGSG